MDISTLYKAAVQAFQARDFNRAIAICQQVAKQNAKVFEFSYLAGLSAMQLQNNEYAIAAFKQALILKPNHQECCYNLGSALLASQEFAQALTYLSLVRSDFPLKDNLHHNLAYAYQGLKELDKALEELDKVATPNSQILNLKGTIFKSKHDFAQATHAFEQSLEKADNDFARISLAAILRIQNRLDEAEAILASAQKSTETRLLHSGILYDGGKFDLAERVLTEALEKEPSNISLQETLNKLYWESGRHERFLQSYSSELTDRDPALAYSYASNLILSKQWQAADAFLDKCLSNFSKFAPLHHAKAVVLSALGSDQEADRGYHHALQLAPDNVRYLVDVANRAIKVGDHKSALPFLTRANQIAPLNQEVWAYLGIVWNLTDSEKYEWLTQPNKLISAEALPTPEGYASLQSYISLLREYLLELHTTHVQPLDQSVRNGTQTNGNLLYYQHQLIRDFKKSMNKRTEHYLSQLPKDPTHPINLQNKAQFKYSGSWSVLLKGNGYHTNHVHPEGWISGPCYIDLPNTMSTDDPNKAGWVKFGETSLGLGEKESVIKSLCPEVGLSVLFPSFMWHGTYPISAEMKQRMTIALDIAPI